jgi:hypothetical protein
MPDGIHPTCLSLGPGQSLRVVNATDVSGYAGVRVTARLASTPRAVLSPGDGKTYPRRGARLLRHPRNDLYIAIAVPGLGRGDVTVWRVRSDGTLDS